MFRSGAKSVFLITSHDEVKKHALNTTPQPPWPQQGLLDQSDYHYIMGQILEIPLEQLWHDVIFQIGFIR